MARGIKRHLKRLAAPSSWMLSKLGGTFAPKPANGPHKMRECIPLILLLRNRLKYALTKKEVTKIVLGKMIKVDKKIRTNSNFPLGLMDVVEIEKTGEHFRMLYDTKGRFCSHLISVKEAEYKLCKVTGTYVAKKGIPYLKTSDGRNIRYPDPLIKNSDTIRLNLITGKIDAFIKFEIGKLAMVTGGNNTGCIGKIIMIEKHLNGQDIVYLKNERGDDFSTRFNNVFVIGDEKDPHISLLPGNGVRLTITEERNIRISEHADK